MGFEAGETGVFEELALKKLKAVGLRVTMPRIQVIRALASTTTPLSAYGIHEEVLRSGGRIDVVSVYRILRTLREVGLIHHIVGADGYLPCGLDGHHGVETEHIICTECGRVDEVELEQVSQKSIMAQGEAAGFEVETIRVEIIGVCPSCRTGA